MLICLMKIIFELRLRVCNQCCQFISWEHFETQSFVYKNVFDIIFNLNRYIFVYCLSENSLNANSQKKLRCFNSCPKHHF